MKLISTILAILILFLAVQPACLQAQAAVPATECCAEGCTEDGSKAPSDEPEHGQDCKGCNPFQACSCCSASLILPQIAFGLPQIFPESIALSWRQREAGLPQKAMSDFWQPPRHA